VTKTQDSFVLAIVENPEIDGNLHSLVEFSHFIASGLGLPLMVSILSAPSLVHYGQFDTLASSKTKEEFVAYVIDSEKKEFEHIKQTTRSICPEASCVFLGENAFGAFLERKRKGIVLATYMEHLGRRRLFARPPSFLKTLKKMDINVLSCRNPYAFKTLK